MDLYQYAQENVEESERQKYIKEKCYYKTLNHFNLKKKYNRNKFWTINSIKTIIKKDYLDEEFNNLKI